MRNFRKCPLCGVLVDAGSVETHAEEARGSMAVLAAALEAGEAGRVRHALDHDPNGATLFAWRDEAVVTRLKFGMPMKHVREEKTNGHSHRGTIVRALRLLPTNRPRAVVAPRSKFRLVRGRSGPIS